MSNAGSPTTLSPVQQAATGQASNAAQPAMTQNRHSSLSGKTPNDGSSSSSATQSSNQSSSSSQSSNGSIKGNNAIKGNASQSSNGSIKPASNSSLSALPGLNEQRYSFRVEKNKNNQSLYHVTQAKKKGGRRSKRSESKRSESKRSVSKKSKKSKKTHRHRR